MRIAKVQVQKSEMTLISIEIPEWEIPMLENEYGPEKINVLGFSSNIKPYPSAREEYERLGLKYGTAEGGNDRKTELTYGRGAMGVSVIAQLIEKSKQDEIDGSEETVKQREAKAAEMAKMDGIRAELRAELQKERDAADEARIAKLREEIRAEERQRAKDEVLAELTGGAPASDPPAPTPAPAAKGSATLGLKK